MSKQMVLAVVAGCFIALAASRAARAETPIRLKPGDDPNQSEAVLFPFDSYSVPYRHGVELTLVPASKKGPVLEKGPPGAPDSGRIDYYGTVIRLGNKLHMWYRGASDKKTNYFRVCYATSDDGVKWERP